MRTLQNISKKENELEWSAIAAFTGILIFNGIHPVKACNS